MTRAVAMLLGCPHASRRAGRAKASQVGPAPVAGRPPIIAGRHLGQLSLVVARRSRRGAAFLDNLAPLASRPDVPPLATMAWYYGALTIAYRDGNDGEVKRLMREVVAFAQKWGTQHRLANAYWVTAQAYAAAGDRAEAAACIESAVRSGHPDVVGAHFLRAAIALGEGNADLAIGEATAAYERAGRAGNTQQRGLLAVQLAMAFAVKGDDRARKHIDELRDLAARSHSAIFQLHAQPGGGVPCGRAGSDGGVRGRLERVGTSCLPAWISSHLGSRRRTLWSSR